MTSTAATEPAPLRAQDRARLAQSLPSLLDAADELRGVAAALGAPAADIHLDEDATETRVKRTQLESYRVVYFATHGLVAGDVKGFGKPSLALTLPAKPTQLDDGLLTASEVAQLKRRLGGAVGLQHGGGRQAPKHCRASRAPSSMPGRGRCWCRTGQSPRTRRQGSPPRLSAS
jgi:hypothetical protein